MASALGRAVQNTKLSQLRQLMKAKDLSAFMLLHSDAHQSEYLAPTDERIAYFSGFTGSNAIALTTFNESLLWTDGRYYLQAEKQLEEGWSMMKMEPPVPPPRTWITENLSESRIGVDTNQITAASFNANQTALQKHGSELVSLQDNLVDGIWAGARPLRPAEPVWVLRDEYSGQSTQDKLSILEDKMSLQGASMLLVTALDDIAWLLNMRGNDIQYNPLFFSYVVHDVHTGTHIFIDPKHLNSETQDYFKANRITTHPYDGVIDFFKETSKRSDLTVSLDPNQCSQYFYSSIKSLGYEIKDQDKPILSYMKTRKNKVQQQGMRAANIRDCAAIVKYFGFLNKNLSKPEFKIDEYDGARKVEEFRAQSSMFLQPSFDTISSIGPNGAVIHYKPEKETSLELINNEIYLLDSGGQYYDGTTDITRTVHFGGSQPTKFQKEAYTRVLLGTISLGEAAWPKESRLRGCDLDVLARQYLYQAGLDYRHGTGHGVGCLLCVHEGPISISKMSKVELEEGMCISDEPGYYKDGEFGIRIENVLLVTEKDKDSLKFENLTMAPYCRELIDVSLLSDKQLKHINEYHQKCEELLAPLLEDDPIALDYLKSQCQPLEK